MKTHNYNVVEYGQLSFTALLLSFIKKIAFIKITKFRKCTNKLYIHKNYANYETI
ncbi:hypothetical protein [Flavobacterium flavigenum]|uniref:hypothetical protein n=1 Tax=Flavobacterium flavigenum TaxID=3003258 RepID=UPI0022ABF56C|nr:hypothetical protein [Flavobacterium flavigenum]